MTWLTYRNPIWSFPHIWHLWVYSKSNTTGATCGAESVVQLIVCLFVYFLFFWTLYCLSFELWLQTTPLVSSNSSVQKLHFVGILDTSAPGQIGTCVRHFGTMTNRHPDNSAPQLDKSVLVCFFFDFTYKTSNSLEPIPNFNYVCSGKDPDHADSNPDPRSVIDEKKRLILFFFLVMLMFALYNIMVRIVILMFCNPFFCILSFNNCV